MEVYNLGLHNFRSEYASFQGSCHHKASPYWWICIWIHHLICSSPGLLIICESHSFLAGYFICMVYRFFIAVFIWFLKMHVMMLAQSELCALVFHASNGLILILYEVLFCLWLVVCEISFFYINRGRNNFEIILLTDFALWMSLAFNCKGWVIFLRMPFRKCFINCWSLNFFQIIFSNRITLERRNYAVSMCRRTIFTSVIFSWSTPRMLLGQIYQSEKELVSTIFFFVYKMFNLI